MPELPTGTVTFLFTDVEGSTRLLQELGERYADVLAEHRRALREAFARHSGVEVDAQGDAEFPPLKSLDQTNLPVQPTPFVGRDRELAEVLGLLGVHRIVTITG